MAQERGGPPALPDAFRRARAADAAAEAQVLMRERRPRGAAVLNRLAEIAVLSTFFYWLI